MTTPCAGCSQLTDPRQLVREGTDQEERAKAAPDPAQVPVDERRPEHAMVFASAYADYLAYVHAGEGPGFATAPHTWRKFFNSDVSARLAVIAIEDVTAYQTLLREALRSLQDPGLTPDRRAMLAALRAVFDGVGTLAARLDEVHGELPADQPLRDLLGNLIRSTLSPLLQRLLGYYRAGLDPRIGIDGADPPTDILLLGKPLESLGKLVHGSGLSEQWPAGVGARDWAAYVPADLGPYNSAYGDPTAPTTDLLNHLATHHLFTSICDTFLAAFARVVDEAKEALERSLDSNGHQPHYALFLAFLRLLEYARDEVNTLSAKHLDFYYRDVLRLEKRPAEPDHAHVLVELARHIDAHLLTEGTALRAGKDDTGHDVQFAVDHDLVANRAMVDELKSLYRHHNTSTTETLPQDDGRIFAGPIDATAESWHPFAEKAYARGMLQPITTPGAEVGFAIASHYLWLAEGQRTITVDIDLTGPIEPGPDLRDDLRCRLTTAKDLLERQATTVTVSDHRISLTIELDGNDPPVTPYDATVHGFDFATSLPMLVITVRHRSGAPWAYAALSTVRAQSITLTVTAQGMTSVAVSNDQGPVDPAKPFLAFGSVPQANSALVIGSTEVFQKSPSQVTLTLTLMTQPVAHDTEPTMSLEYLDEGRWRPVLEDGRSKPAISFPGIGARRPGLLRPGILASTALKPVIIKFPGVPQPTVVTPDLTPDVPYAATTRAGFVRLRLSDGFGADTYPVDLAAWMLNPKREDGPPTAPVLPTVRSLTVDYTASQRLDLTAPSEGHGRFFQVGPFGHAEQTLLDAQAGVPLVPLFETDAGPSEGELYLGVRDLRPPQNLALLFQVVDGSANPLVVKPPQHIQWSYLAGNTWVPFPTAAVSDGTEELLVSGIITLTVPGDADTDHTLLPAGLHWIRLAVPTATDAVCRLQAVCAQALRATYVIPEDQTASHPKQSAAGTITKLKSPDPAVKRITQRFPTFGGRPLETPAGFATRVSERLRHKDRAIALWDYEHLVLEAFPTIYRARCLNHTRYEPSASGTGTYSELAPGHVTVVTIPDLDVPNPYDPLRPCTSLGVLEEIQQFLARRMSCFATLHVRNPQFEEVRADLHVRFRHGVDESFMTGRLQDEITRFLSPWAYRGDARPSFRGKVYKSVLVDFIEEQPYVDYLTDVHLYHRLPGAGPNGPDGPDLDEVTGSRTVAILVSAPPGQHGIHPIHPEDERPPAECGCTPRAGVLPP